MNMFCTRYRSVYCTNDRNRTSCNYFQYTTLVKPAFEEFCLPTKKYADVIVPRGAENTVAIDLIKQHIQDLIFRSAGGNKTESNCHERSRSNSDSTNTSR